MKTLKVNVWERIQLLACVPQEAPISEVRKHLRVLDLLELNEDEKEMVGFKEVQTMTPRGLTTTAQWGDGAAVEPDHEFEIEFEDADFNHLKTLVDKRNNWPTSRQAIALIDKFEVKQ